jgi:hypothetical protein
MLMKLRPWILIVVFAVLAVAGFRYWKQESPPPPGIRVTKESVPRTVTVTAPATSTAPETAAAAPVSTENAERWSREATGVDAGKRAAAITALAQAPVGQALPVLRRVLMNGEPTVDRPLALQSLRELALNRGDPESAIRNAIREAIYHGDDQTITADAQEALDVIEESQLR